MVADTYSARLGMLEMGTGNQNNSWGSSFNSSVADIIDRAIAGSADRTVTGGTLDLSGSPPPAGPRQDLDAIQVVRGTLTSNQIIIVPALTKTWYWFNATSGPFSVLLQQSGSNTIELPQNTGTIVIANASLLRADRAQVGNFIFHGGTTAPAGAMACNGASLLRADHPDLFTAIGTTWGAVDGTHFTLPNLTDTNRYLRAAGGSLAVGTYQSSQNKSHTHTGSGTTAVESNGITFSFSGTTGAMSANASHSHTTNKGTSGLAASTGLVAQSGGIQYINTTGENTGSTNTDHTHSFSGTTGTQNQNHTHTYSFTTSGGSADGTEARPESAAVLICIKY